MSEKIEFSHFVTSYLIILPLLTATVFVHFTLIVSVYGNVQTDSAVKSSLVRLSV